MLGIARIIFLQINQGTIQARGGSLVFDLAYVVSQ